MWSCAAIDIHGPAVTSLELSNTEKARVELYLDSDKASNEVLFNFLCGEREAIEAEFGEALDWQRLDNNKACRVVAQRARSVPRPRAHLTRYHGVFAPNFKHRRRIIPNPAHRTARHPSQLYEALLEGVLLFAVL